MLLLCTCVFWPCLISLFAAWIQSFSSIWLYTSSNVATLSQAGEFMTMILLNHLFTVSPKLVVHFFVVICLCYEQNMVLGCLRREKATAQRLWKNVIVIVLGGGCPAWFDLGGQFIEFHTCWNGAEPLCQYFTSVALYHQTSQCALSDFGHFDILRHFAWTTF